MLFREPGAFALRRLIAHAAGWWRGAHAEAALDAASRRELESMPADRLERDLGLRRGPDRRFRPY